jgi:hypothetical protein
VHADQRQEARGEAAGRQSDAHRRAHDLRGLQACLSRQRAVAVGDAPIKGRFSWACITGELDRNKGHWFGLIKTMRDPQMWANKWLSQTLHILNTTAKGGIVAEEDAFADMTEAEEKWAQPDTIVWATTGAVSNPKIMPKPGGGLTQSHVDLMRSIESRN